MYHLFKNQIDISLIDVFIGMNNMAEVSFKNNSLGVTSVNSLSLGFGVLTSAGAHLVISLYNFQFFSVLISNNSTYFSKFKCCNPTYCFS